MHASVGILSLVVVAATGCFGTSHPAQRPSPPAPPASTTATYAGTAATCPRPSTYVPTVSPSRGSPDTTATIGGTLPLYGENGQLRASVTTRLAGWWNVGLAHWIDLVRSPPTPIPARPGPAFRILVVDVPTPNPCTYRLVIRVPGVAPGTYPIELLTYGGGGGASLATVRFTVTGS